MSGCTPDSSGDCKGTKETTPPYTVTIADGDTINGSAYGRKDSSGDVSKATVQMTGGLVTGSVYGGHTITSSAYSNTVSITGGQVDGTVEGGYAPLCCADYNKVTIGGSAQTGDVKGGHCDGNEVTIEGDAITGNVYGATGVRAGFDGTKPNTVTVRGGTINGTVYGGSADRANGNQVIIEGGTVTGDVIGGNSTGSNSSKNNSVTISGGTVNGSVWGSHSTGGTPQTMNNSVTISGGKVTGVVYGGNGTSGTGNTLNVEGKNLPVGGVANFEAISFTLPAGFDAASDVALNITGTEAVNLEGVTIDVGGSIPTLAAGESLTLISKTTGTPKDLTGLPADYEYEVNGSELIIKVPPHTITATVTPPECARIDCGEVASDGTATCTAVLLDSTCTTPRLTSVIPATVNADCKWETMTCTLSNIDDNVTITATLTKPSEGGGSDPGTSTGGDTPGGGTPGGDTPGGDTPGGDTPGGGTPGGDTPGGDTPGGDTPGGDTGGNPDNGGNPPQPYVDSSSPTMGELGLLLSGLALAGAAAPALRRREKQGKKADTHQ